MNGTRRVVLASSIAAVALLGIGGWVVAGRDAGDPLAKCRKTAVSGGMESFGGPFTLTSETGERVTDAQVFDKPTLLYFGFTFCPDVCPADAARNGVAVDDLKAAGYDVKPVFITVDPQRDTPEVMRDFTDQMHPDMLGLTGTDDEIAAVNKLWRNYFKLRNESGDPYYLVDHMTNTYLILPKAGTVEFFKRDDPPEVIAERTECFIDAEARI